MIDETTVSPAAQPSDPEAPAPAQIEQPPRPLGIRFLTATWITLAFAGVFVILNIVGAAVIMRAPFGGDDGESVRLLVGTIAVELLFIAMIAAVVRAVYGGPFLDEMRWRRPSWPSTGMLIVIGVELAVGAMVASAFFPGGDTPIQQILDTPGEVIMFTVFGVLFAPLIEELLFRGFLFRVLDDAAGAVFAVPVTATMFGALHVLQLQGNMAAIVLILIVGLILSILRWRTGSLIPSVIVHTTYNGIIFIVVLLGMLAQRMNMD
jgi:hypothetical protein